VRECGEGVFIQQPFHVRAQMEESATTDNASDLQ
jgi:hypothetical protein